MNLPSLLDLALQFVGLSFLSFGGATALLPELHRVCVEQQHWLTDATFAHLYAIAQAAPGPNVLVVTLIGWELAGLAGALVTTVAFSLPTSIAIFWMFRHWERVRGTRLQRALQLAIAPLAVGLVFSSGTLLGVAAHLRGLALLFVLAVTLAMWRSRLHPLWMIVLGGVLGVFGLI